MFTELAVAGGNCACTNEVEGFDLMNSCIVTILQSLIHFVIACCHAYKIRCSVSVIHCSGICMYVFMVYKSKYLF
jgi:hypothetical protein